MIWYFSKGNHKLAIQPWVRWWLRSGLFWRFIAVIIIYIGLSALSTPIKVMYQYMAMKMPYESRFLLIIPSLLNLARQLAMFSLWVLWIIDSYMERKITRADIKKMMSMSNIVLATRGEYIGGHPELPHGRFVYLALGGTVGNPHLWINLPQDGGKEEIRFGMPVLDLQKATQGVDKTGDETTLSVALANITFRAKFPGEKAVFNIEYIAQAGRKRQVALSNFARGNDEVQTWCNYVVCIQSEAETGKPPYGPWKSLPTGQRAAARTP
ncbi:MAG: hypothetical protein ACYCZF_09595 [Anaerolineae bacterium]